MFKIGINKNRIRKYLVISGVSIPFFIFGIWELFNPQYWSAFIPSFLSQAINNIILVEIHGVILIFIAIWLIIGYKRKIGAIFSSLVLLDILVSLLFSSGFSDLFVRDFAIFIFSLSIIFEEDN